MTLHEDDMKSINGTPRSTVQQMEEGPRIGKDKMMSPKKVTNKRSISNANKFSSKLEKEIDNKENKNIGNLEFPKHDPDESGLKGQTDDIIEKGLIMAKREHTRGFSFNPSPKSIRKSQDKALNPDLQLEGGDVYAQLEQTTQNAVDQSHNNISKVEGSVERKSKSMGAIIGQSPRNETSRALIQREEADPEEVTMNVVKKYNRQLRKIEGGDGVTLDVSGDLYTYSIFMMMNPNVQQNHQQNMA